MSKVLHIEGARLIDPGSGHDGIADIQIQDKHIAAIGARLPVASSAVTIEASGLIACAGFIDLYARLREPGFSRKGTLASETRAALAAGITTVLCAPDTNPAIDSTATVELIRQRADLTNGARVLPIAALTTGLAGKHLSELATLQAAGCVAASHADQPLDSSAVLLRCMEYAASFDMPLIITPRDPLLAVNGCAHAGSVATRLGLPSIPVAAETVALASLLELARNVPCRLHVSRLSSARAVYMVNDAKQAGLPVTADVGMHHLFFSDKQLAGFDVNFHSAVPFRSEADRQALRTGLADNTIDAICSDHAPHDADAKLAPFPGSEPGLSAFDSFVPLLLALPELLGMSLAAVIAKVTTGPAGFLGNGVDGTSPNNLRSTPSGRLNAGQAADIVLIDPAGELNLDEDSLLSLGKNTPLLGMSNLRDCSGEAIPLQGRIHTAIVDGVSRLTPAE